MPARIRIGCAIWAYKGWVGSLFPAGSKRGEFLSLYSRRLTTVEGNTTFYAVPSEETVRRWAAETPESFQFCPKIPQEISHHAHLEATVEATQAFVERMALLGPRLGPCFLQLPPSFSPVRLNDLEAWLAAWPREARIAVEVRHPAWFAPRHEQALNEMLERHQAGRVLLDVRPLELAPLPGQEEDLQRARDNKPQVPLHPLHTGAISLIRYIGHPEVALNGPLLDEWAARLASWLADGIAVYFFCHCPQDQYSPALCRELQQRLERLAPIPPLPWDGLSATQQAMFS